MSLTADQTRQQIQELLDVLGVTQEEHYSRCNRTLIQPHLIDVFSNLSPALSDKVRSMLDVAFREGVQFGTRAERLRTVRTLIDSQV